MSSRAKRQRFEGPFIAHLLSMRESFAWKFLSNNARRVIDRLEREHAAHGGSKNGSLICTYDDFEEVGLRRQSIALAIRECVALGFLEVTFTANPAVANHKSPSTYRLTYLFGRGSSPARTDDWMKIGSNEAAEEALQRARAGASALHVHRAKRAVAKRR